jgi:hypothetical protein
MGSPAVVLAGWSGSRARWWSGNPGGHATIPACASACTPLPASGAGSATDGCTCSCAARGGRPTTSSWSGSIARRSWPSAAAVGRRGLAACRRARGARSRPTSAGPWTSSRTAWPTAVGSEPPISRTTARASARRSWSTFRSRAGGWPPCSRTLPVNAAIPTCWSWTTDPSCAAVISTAGPTRTV